MGMQLGLDGKIRAVQVNSGNVPAQLSYYVGLLETLPADPDGLTLSELVSTVGLEFTPSGSWYTGGRIAMTFETPPGLADENGAFSLNLSSAQWTNTTGSPISIEGVFITSVQSGTGGLSLWVGTPDVGTSVVENGSPVDILVSGLAVGVD